MRGNLMATGVCSLRWRDALKRWLTVVNRGNGYGGVSLYPVGLHAAVWFGSGKELPLGNAWQLDGNGGMQSAQA